MRTRTAGGTDLIRANENDHRFGVPSSEREEPIDVLFQREPPPFLQTAVILEMAAPKRLPLS